ncbi:hypothetical protein ERX46_07310 [Brumimicrobium glaciale]|uniref:OmpA-like domain-containing protein n=1 Tax=Brumimicrobium glaciale TaxID=200475 RepID=A0A4Q4KL72_9FLAO|nr:hypothetical protein [Brumimicrobium glaciale]RYM33768.1 hypothetical protein ERX46_07310 [Brumimicrobium glaciale]
MKNIISLLLIINFSMVYSQCVPLGYKSFSDTVFEKNYKILCPIITFNLSGGPGIQKENSDSSLIIIADFINSNENFIFEIGSHTDQRGSEKGNLI